MLYSHRNASTQAPTIVGHFWFKGFAYGYAVEEKVTVMMYTSSGQLRAIGIEAGSDMAYFEGLWWGPEAEIPPWKNTNTNNIIDHRAITAILVPEEYAIAVKFHLWGVPCASVFDDVDAALKWCKICVHYNFCYPLLIFGPDGEVLYDEDTLLELTKEE